LGAVITKSDQTRIVAGLTRVVISAQDSFQSVSSPVDAAMTVARATWDMGDGTVKTGLCVQHQWATPGVKTVTLVVNFKNGAPQSTTSTTYNVEAAPAYLGFDKYVAANGSDGNPGTQDQPYLTPEKAFDAWRTFRGASSTGFQFGRISFRKGDTIVFANGTQPHPDFGPLLVTSYGSGVRPTIAATAAVDGVGLTLSSGGHDNLYDNPIFWKGVNLSFNANHETVGDVETLVGLAHVATQLEDCIVTNAGILMSLNGGATPHGGSLFNVEINNSYKNGVFFSANFAVIEQCNIHDNGHIDARDNEIYASAGCSRSAVINTRLSGLVNPTTSGGLNCSGVNKLYIADLEVEHCRTAFGPGGNDSPPGEVTQDVVCERLVGIDIQSVGIYANYMNRVSVRNPILYRCLGPVVRLQSYNSGQRIDQLEILNASFSLCKDGISAESDGDATDGQSTNVVIENMVLSMPTSGTGIVDHIFFMLKTQASIAGFTLKNNQYHRIGDNDASTTFAMVGGYAGGAPISFTDWVTNISNETGSQYGDPLFTNANDDLSLQTLSPCVDAGIANGLTIEDILGTSRPQGSSYDIGAYEYIPIVGLAAFPGAEGFGTNTIGGRGGVVLHVTNLNESGPGSLREATQYDGPHIIVFDISGVIDHKEKALAINKPFVTILGQTAPGDGICLSGEEVRIHTHDVVIRYLRIRTGDVDDPHDGWDNRDCLNTGEEDALNPGQGTGEVYNIVIDHCSMSWAVDESLTMYYDTHDITVQWCMIYEGLSNSFHPEGPHSMGLLTGLAATNISIHHNLIANCNERNPQFAGNLGNYDPNGVIDFRNNLIFNWQLLPCEISKPGNRVNLVANWWKRGPNSPGQPVAYPILVQTNGTSAAPDAQIYVSENVSPTLDGRGGVDNWPMVRNYGLGQLPSAGHQLSAPLECPAVTTYDAKTAASMILDSAGATRPRRDVSDARVVQGARRTCWPLGTDFIIDSPTEVGGWPVLESTNLPLDTDQDGMPDFYEIENGLDPEDPSDGAAIAANGYSNVENWAETLI